MFKDEFKERYTTVPIAIYGACLERGEGEVITHQHKEIEIISMRKGCADFYVNSRAVHLKQGDVLVIPPYALHRATVSAGIPTQYYCICFDQSLLCDGELGASMINSAGSCGWVARASDTAASACAAYAEGAYLACEGNAEGWELCSVGNLSLLFSVMKREIKASENPQNKREADFGKKVMTYIIDNYSLQITSKNLAEALHMNHSHFCRLFKITFGSCFANYLLAYRLEKARALLRGGSAPVTEVAFLSGFNDCSYFGKAFKQRFGITPLACRKQKT